jgi:hypothetical protein
MIKTMPKKELFRQIKRFLMDENRGISIKLFSELCGLHLDSLDNVFIKEIYPMTEYVQVRVSKGYNAWRNGEVAVMQNRDKTRFVEYRKEAKPRLSRGLGIQFVNGEAKLKIGLKNRNDYSDLDIDEQLRG